MLALDHVQLEAVVSFLFLDLGLVVLDDPRVLRVCDGVVESRQAAGPVFEGLGDMEMEGMVALPRLRAFLQLLRKHYMDNPYHTWHHAVDVAHSQYMFMALT